MKVKELIEQLQQLDPEAVGWLPVLKPRVQA